MFNLEKSIQTWKRKLRSNSAFEDGDIAELESHLRDEVERLKMEGFSEEEAFNIAVKELGIPEELADEMEKQNRRKGSVPTMTERPRWMPEMIFHYLKIAHRILLRNPGYTFLNLSSLILGMTGAILLALYVHHTYSFDQFHENSDSLYRVVQDVNTATEQKLDAITPPPLAAALKQEYPEVIRATRVEYENLLLKKSGNLLEERVAFVDEDFFEMFTFPELQSGAFAEKPEPGEIFLTRSVAEKYFGTTEVLGETISVVLNNKEINVTVAGILQDVPENSSIQFNVLLPFLTWQQGHETDVSDSWANNFLTTFIQLQEGSESVKLESKFQTFIEKYYGSYFQQQGFESDLSYLDFVLQPLSEIHTNTSISEAQEPISNPILLNVLFFITGFVLFISCFNFVNLSIARAFGRGKEIAMRKVMGARKNQIIWQVFSEALLICTITLGCSLLLTQSVLPFFNDLTGQSLSFSTVPIGFFVLLLTGITVLIALLAGGYPAWVQSGIPILPALKKKLKIEGNNLLGRSLIVIQFGVAAILLVSTFLINEQLNFLQNKDLGITTDEIVVIPLDLSDYDRRAPLLKNEIVRQTGLQEVTIGSTPMSHWWARRGMDVNDVHFQTYHIKIDPDFVETFDISVKDGRNFQRKRATDSESSVLINEAFAEKVGWQDPVGKQFTFAGQTVEVIGVVNNFNFISLHYAVGPLVLHMQPSEVYGFLFANVPTNQVQEYLPEIEKIWSQMADKPFTYRFLDEWIDQQYSISADIQMLGGYGSGLAMLLACMGLLGISSLYIARRTKEIGIRKVLGASAWDIIRTIITEYGKLVFLGFLVATPLAYLLVSELLGYYAYRVQFGAGPFLLAGGLIIMIAILTISYKTIKAGFTNPADVIKNE